MKKFILRLLPWVIVAGLLAALVIFVGIPLYAPSTEVHELNPSVFYYEGDSAPITMESDQLLFEMDPSTTQFKITEKVTGRQWFSTPENAASDPLALAANKETLQSTLIVSYATTSGAIDLNNYKYSIVNGNFTIEKLDDQSIKVNYAVGNIEKTYLIPTAITKERFVAFTDQMSKSNGKKLKNYYSLYEPEKLDSKKNKDEIIAMYPEVQNQALYILKSDTSEKNKQKVQDYFAEVNYSQEDYEIDQQLVAGRSESTAPVFNVSMVYRLDGNDFVVEVPYSDIRYKPEYPITYVTPLPMFGAAGTSDQGFILIPEGGGALINYNNNKVSQSSYYANLYGWDYGTFRKELISETRNNFPVFGMTRNGGSFICMLEGATSYAGIQADFSNRYNSYNYVSARHNVLHYDSYNMSAKTAQLVYMFEKDVPQDTLIQRYRFINSDKYVDMAAAYGNYLKETTILKDAYASAEIPVSVEVVGAIDKTVVKFGLPIDSVYPTTTFAQTENMILDLSSGGIKNLNVRMSGWANGGVTQKVLTRVDVLRELGGKNAMKKLIATANEQNIPLYFDGISCFAYDSNIFDGFISFSDAARHTTREHITIYPYDIITYQPSDWLDPYYMVTPEYAKQGSTNLINALAEVNAYGVAFRDIGNLLSADYNPRNTVTREEVLAMNVATLQEAKAAGQHIMIKQGNIYAVPYADLITDVPFVGTNYGIIDESVPFFQIALHGLKDYTGQPLNLSNDYHEEFLKCVEYGSGLNFTFMAEDTQLLQDTLHSGYFASYYTHWRDDVIKMVTRYQADMTGLNQQTIINHSRLTEDVTVTTYADGTAVYVNYGETAYTINGTTVPARDYAVERGYIQ